MKTHSRQFYVVFESINGKIWTCPEGVVLPHLALGYDVGLQTSGVIPLANEKDYIQQERNVISASGDHRSGIFVPLNLGKAERKLHL